MDPICTGYKITQKNLNLKLYKDNRNLFEAMKVTWWGNEYVKGYYLHKFNKPNKYGLTATFKRIETPKKVTEEYEKIKEYCQEIKRNLPKN
jgi:hypothetical protein